MSGSRRRPRCARSFRTGGGSVPSLPGPKISTVSVTAGKAAGGDVVHVTGTGLGAVSTALGSISGNTGLALDITTNAHAAGTFVWSLTNLNGTSPNQVFTYLAAPVVSAISPTHGPATVSNTARTITCSGLPPVGSGATLTATVGGNAVTSIVNNGDGTFTCTVPTHSAGTANVVVTVDGVASSGGTGLYTFDAVPTFTSAQYVDTAGGSTFLIGTGFLSGMTVSVNINGTPTSLTSVDVSNGGTFATATLPAGSYTAGSWNITLTNPDTQSVTGAAGFTIFDSTSIAGLLWDFDANAGVTSSGGLVSSWVDQKSGNSITATASGAARPTLTANAQGTWPSVDGDGSGTWMLTGNVTHATKAVTVVAVMRVPASTNNAVLFEATNNARAASVNGYGALYQTAGPQLDVYNGSTGNSTLNEETGITGTDVNSNYRVYVFTFDRSKTWPITIVTGVPVMNDMYINGAHAGENYVTGQSSASNYDTAPLSLFARNVAAAASAPSKVSFLRIFAYNTALSFTQRANVIAALSSRYGTNQSPFTAQLIVPGDSISSSFDTIGSQTWATYIYANRLYDNLQMDVLAFKGWTASDCYTNRANWSPIRRSDIPCDFLGWLSTNDLASGDTLSPATVWTSSVQPLISYVFGLSSPAIRNIGFATVLPRNSVASGTAASFEAKRVGRDTSGNALPGRAQNHAYLSTTPDWILINDGSGNPTLFRCTTSGTTANNAGPAYTFTDGAVTTDGTAHFTCYGRPINDLINDASNQATYHYVAIDIGNPSTVLGTYANTSDTDKYADGIHPTQKWSTGQTTSTPSGAPFAGSVLSYIVPFLQQGGTWSRPYLPPVVSSISPSSAAVGSPIALTGREFGVADATHPIRIGGLDCTGVVVATDVSVVTAVVPTSLAVGGPYDVVYKRSDGQTATLAAAFTAVQPVITGVAVGSLTATSAETLDRHVLNATTITIAISNGGGYGVTAATFGGVSLTSVTSSADGSTVTGTLPVGTYSAGTGDVTVSSPSSPTTLTGGAIFVNLLDPTIIWNTSTQLAAWYRGDSLVGSPATSWTNKSTTIGTNTLTSTGSPTVNAASSVFQQNGTGVQTVTLNGSSMQFHLASTFAINTSEPTAVFFAMVVKLTGGSTGGRMVSYAGAGGRADLGIVSNASVTPTFSDNYTAGSDITWSTTVTTAAAIYGYTNGLTANTHWLRVIPSAEVTNSGTMNGTGIKKTGTFSVGYDGGSGFCGGELAEVVATCNAPTATQARQYAIYCHNYFNTPV